MPNRTALIKVRADAEKIVRAIRAGTTVTEIVRRYHTSHDTLIKEIFSLFDDGEWDRLRRERLSRGGRETRLKKGLVPWNKGIPFNPGGRCAETRFKKGEIRGAAARRYRPVGTITIRSDQPPRRLRNRKRKAGMAPWPRKKRRWIKVRDSGPAQLCWIPYARYLYEKMLGAVPKGLFVVHADGDIMNDAVENLMLIDRREHMLRVRRDAGFLELRRKGAAKAAHARRGHRVTRKGVVFWYCPACGFSAPEEVDRCPKCGARSFERREAPLGVAI